MKFEYRLNFNDFKEVNRAHGRKDMIKSNLIFAAFLVLTSLIPLLSKGIISQAILLRAFLPSLGIVTFTYFITQVIRHFLIKRTWNSQPSSINEISVETSDEELKMTTPLSESKRKWSAFTHWQETSNLFLIYQSHNSLNMFPKRAFMSSEQIHEFRELLRSKLPNR